MNEAEKIQGMKIIIVRVMKMGLWPPCGARVANLMFMVLDIALFKVI